MPDKTPTKVAAKTKDKKKAILPGNFGGAVEKFDQCKVCGSARDSDQVGGTCHWCLRSCRQLFHHQRIAEIMPCPKDLEAVKSKSLAARPKEKRRVKRGQDDLLATVAEQLGQVMPCLDNILQRLDRLEGANPKRSKAK
jgi:hypothetical protein